MNNIYMCKVKILRHSIVKWTALLVHIRPMKNLNKYLLVEGKELPTQLFCNYCIRKIYSSNLGPFLRWADMSVNHFFLIRAQKRTLVYIYQ